MPTVELDDSGAPTITLPEGDCADRGRARHPQGGRRRRRRPGRHRARAVHRRQVVGRHGLRLELGQGRRSGVTSRRPGSSRASRQALEGQTVGSQVLVVIPPAFGYGEAGSPSTSWPARPSSSSSTSLDSARCCRRPVARSERSAGARRRGSPVTDRAPRRRVVTGERGARAEPRGHEVASMTACDACSSSAPPARSAPRRSTSSAPTPAASRSWGCRPAPTAPRWRRRPTEFEVEYTALGAEEAEQLVRDVEADVVLNGITGSVGLGPTLAALETGPDPRARQQGVAHRGRRPRHCARAARVRSCPSTPSTPRSRRRCGRASARRSAGSC